MSNSATQIAAQAMNTVGILTAARAHNIANVNTEEFDPLRVSLETGPRGQGVRVAEVSTAQSRPPPPDLPASDPNVNPEAAVIASHSRSIAPNVNIATEITGLSRDQIALQANAEVIRTEHEMAGRLLDTVA
jgi:flagellar basal-body rod protein FlgC